MQLWPPPFRSDDPQIGVMVLLLSGYLQKANSTDASSHIVVCKNTAIVQRCIDGAVALPQHPHAPLAHTGTQPPEPPTCPSNQPLFPPHRARAPAPHAAAGITVSGISSGAAFAAQVAVAFSGTVRGAAIFAGKPWMCERVANAVWEPGVSESTCNVRPDLINLSALESAAAAAEQNGDIDPLSQMQQAGGRYYVYRGSSDPIYREVDGVSALNYTASFFARYAGPTAVKKEIDTVNSGHCVPTVDYGVSPCSATGSPYINHCGVDGMGDALRWMLPDRDLVRDPSAVDTHRLVWFDQRPFFWGPTGAGDMGPSPGLADAGAIYIPAACAGNTALGRGVDSGSGGGGSNSNKKKLTTSTGRNGDSESMESGNSRDTTSTNADSESTESGNSRDTTSTNAGTSTLCDLHVSFHGCGMDNSTIGDVYVMHAGLLEWAEKSRVVVLFPQTGGATMLANAPQNATAKVSRAEQQENSKSRTVLVQIPFLFSFFISFY
jgi:poly(3-hydroxybutyrate) depolymerase